MMDMDDDGFFTDDDDLGLDNDPGIIGEATKKLLDAIEKVVDIMKKNIQFNETEDYSANLNCLSSYVSNLVDLDSLTDDDLSDEEVSAQIDDIIRQTTVITMSNINSLLGPDETESETKQISQDANSDGTDW